MVREQFANHFYFVFSFHFFRLKHMRAEQHKSKHVALDSYTGSRRRANGCPSTIFYVHNTSALAEGVYLCHWEKRLSKGILKLRSDRQKLERTLA